jgi:hypothetical protein
VMLYHGSVDFIILLFTVLPPHYPACLPGEKLNGSSQYNQITV